jgi:hypothetical protein
VPPVDVLLLSVIVPSALPGAGAKEPLRLRTDPGPEPPPVDALLLDGIALRLE